VIVFLPQSYATEKNRRYPVVYAGARLFDRRRTVDERNPCAPDIEGAYAQGAQDMIVVLPDSKTVHNGSMYSSSATTGDFERFIAHDVIAYIDAHYRTIPKRTSRGLAGHSMGAVQVSAMSRVNIGFGRA
jgi:enterochelin esterase-like enzyme